MIVERIKEDYFPANSFFVLSKPGIEILKKVHIAGNEFKALNYYASIEFLKAAYNLTLIKDDREGELACLSILRSGPHYSLVEAYYELTKKKIGSAVIGARRKRTEDGKITAEIYSENLGPLSRGVRHVITSEIIASGSTLKTVADYILKRHNVKEWTIFSIAAAEKGCRLLKKIEEEHKIRINLLVNGFIGGLEKNETDIPFHHPNTIMPQRLEMILKNHYGVELFEKIPCCIGDGGERFLNPKGHYEEFIKTYSAFKVSDKKSLSMLTKMLKEAKQKLYE